MMTRMKSGAIEKKNYATFLATFPKLNFYNSQKMSHFFGGFSFVPEVTDYAEPSSFRKASSLPQWQKAMQEKYDSLRAQGTWSLVPIPTNRAIVGSKWVYKVKENPDGSVSRYKARLVA